FADRQAALRIDRHPVRSDERSGRGVVLVVAARAPELRDALGRRPSPHHVARDVAEQQVALAEVDRAFGEQKTCRDALGPQVCGNDRVDRRVESDDGRSRRARTVWHRRILWQVRAEVKPKSPAYSGWPSLTCSRSRNRRPTRSSVRSRRTTRTSPWASCLNSSTRSILTIVERWMRTNRRASSERSSEPSSARWR